MIDGTTLSPWELIYTFIAPDGRNIHIHASRLRLHCLALGYKPVSVPLDVPLARTFIRDNIVDPKRVATLTDDQCREPILVCKTEAFGTRDPIVPDVLLVDGHHRFVRAAMDGRHTIVAWLLERYQWQPFQIVNLPSRTIEALHAEPITPKPHWKTP